MPEQETSMTPKVGREERYAIDVFLQEVTSSICGLTAELAAIRVVLSRVNPSSPKIASERIKALISMWSDKRKGWLSRRNWDQKRTVDRVKHLEELLRTQREEFAAANSQAHPPAGESADDAALEFIQNNRCSIEVDSAAYRNLVKLLRSRESAHEDGWVSTRDRLPDEDELILVAVQVESDDHDGVTQRWEEVHEATMYRAGCQLVAVCVDNSEYIDDEILGWRPLPCAPSKEKR